MCAEVEKALGRLEDLRRGNLPHEELVSVLLTELSSALRELQATANELFNQGEELASSRHDLEEEQRRYQELFEFAPDGYLVTDTEGIILTANTAAAKIFNVSRSFLLGKPLPLFVCSEQRSYFQTRLTQLKQGVGLPDGDWEFEMLSSKHAPVPVYMTVGTIATARGETAELLWLLRDITMRRQMEAELHKADKLESLGILAGGIAHDFNNFLTVVLGNLSMARMYTNEGDKVSKYHQETENAINQTRGLIGQLLTFAKGGEPLTNAVSIRNFIEEVSSFALSGSKTFCELHVEDLPPMEVDRGQITQVISNLLINADQAMPKGGTIKITAEQLVVTQDAGPLPLQPGNYIAITIADSGTGISKQDLPRIFDPYYSTKEHGSGLGLTICYSIVKKHGGHISVDTVEGEGTSFTIYLPVSSDEAKNEVTDKILRLGEGKILFMDDEEDVRNTAGEMLTFLGYDVDFAQDGDMALRMYEQAHKSGSPYDAVITDLTVRGGMGGKETVGELLKLNPHVKAIVSSGYSNDALMVEYDNHGFSGSVAKPYRLVELGEVLSKVITGRSKD